MERHIENDMYKYILKDIDNDQSMEIYSSCGTYEPGEKVIIAGLLPSFLLPIIFKDLRGRVSA